MSANFAERMGMTQEQLSFWLKGREPFTPEEQKIVSSFISDNARFYAQETISLRRQALLDSFLGGNGSLSPREQVLVDGLTDRNRDFYSKEIVQAARN